MNVRANKKQLKELGGALDDVGAKIDAVFFYSEYPVGNVD